MLFKKTAVQVAELDSPSTVIGKGIYLEAIRMSGQESIRVDGMYKGAIETEGSLVLGDSGSIIGDVSANYFLVAGEMTGNIKCATQLHLASSAKVSGNIQAASLIVDEGCQVSGSYSIGAEKLSQELLQGRADNLRLQTAADGK